MWKTKTHDMHYCNGVIGIQLSENIPNSLSRKIQERFI